MEGTPFGQYRLIELLGRGGMGEVWRAYDAVTDRIVALKVLPALFAQDEVFKHRFRREAHAAARLSEPHVVPIHTYGEIEGRLFVDMRLIKGRDLQTVLADGPMEPTRAVGIIEQAARALHAAHEVGLVHRDVKPSNVLVTDDDFAYLIDFGIARAAGETGLTGTGGVIGTWHYMAPERLGARDADARSDIYALACVLYECLTGSRPFPGDSLESQVAAHLTAAPPRPSNSHPGLPRGVDAVIAKGMAKDPERRYATTVELAHAARGAITKPVPRPEMQSPSARAGHVIAVAAADLDATQPAGISATSATENRPVDDVPTKRREPAAERPLAPAPPSRPWWRRKAVIISAAALLTVIAVAVAVTVAINSKQREPLQATLPFTGLNQPTGVAVDSNGTVYVTDWRNNRVSKLPPGSTTPTALPFTGLNEPWGVAADSNGIVYVADSSNNRVVTLAAGSTAQTELPFTGLNSPLGVAVDNKGTVYVTDDNKRVVTLLAGATAQTVLPFTGLNAALGVAVDRRGGVYVADGYKNQVLTLPAGSTTQTTLPFTDLNNPWGVAVDSKDTVYVTDSYNKRVVTLPPE